MLQNWKNCHSPNRRPALHESVGNMPHPAATPFYFLLFAFYSVAVFAEHLQIVQLGFTA
jgi:hypothetical protein